MMIKANTPSKEIIIMGDYNANYNKKGDYKEFKNILLLNGFTQMIKSPTRVTKDSSTVIDIIASNNESNIKDTVTIPTSLNNHFMVGSLCKLNHQKFLPKEVKFRDYSKYNVDILIQQLTAVDWSIIYDCENVDNCVELLTDILEKHFNENAPLTSKRVKGIPCPWLDADLKNRMNAQDKMYGKAIKLKNDEDWNRYKQLHNKCNN